LAENRAGKCGGCDAHSSSHAKGLDSAPNAKAFNKKRNERYLDGIYAKEVEAYKDWQATGNPASYQRAWDLAHVFSDTVDFAIEDHTVTKNYDTNKNYDGFDFSRDPSEVSGGTGNFEGHSGAVGSQDIGGIP
jgi:hypothetical protein